MDTDLAPKSPSEAAIITTLPANNTAYSAIMRGLNGSGIGLAEVYDLDKGPGSQLLNLSSRGFVQTGDNVMIGGLIIAGTSFDQGAASRHRAVIIRLWYHQSVG